MEPPVEKRPIAWRPLTPRGAAAFAHATLGRLLLVQFVVAVLAACALAWAMHAAWYPIIGEAIAGLPPHGAIRNGQLDWRGGPAESLANGRCLALSVDMDHAGATHSPADIQVEFGRGDVWIRSLLGYVRTPYPRRAAVPFNSVESGPWWGAWAPPILAIVMAGVVVGLMLAWAILATVYSAPVWLIGFFANRDLNLRASWRLAGAGLMPGALFLSLAVIGYGLGALDLVQLLAAAALHLLIGWIYAAVAPIYARRNPTLAETAKNPFGSGSPK
jgi:hypothetical protein